MKSNILVVKIKELINELIKGRKILIILFIIGAFLVVGLFCKTVVEFQEEPQPWILDILIEFDEEYLNDSKYTLAVVTTGLHDKINWVKIFAGDIKYDKYGNPIYDNVIFEDYIDLEPEDSEVIKSIESGNLDFKNRNIIIKLSTEEEIIFDISEVH